MRGFGSYAVVALLLSRSVTLAAAQAESPKAEVQVRNDASEKAPPEKVPTESDTRNRAGENLLGQADTSQGEARRNENVQINLLDTNAVRELNTRVGTTATIVQEFVPERGYWASSMERLRAFRSGLSDSKVPAFMELCPGITITVSSARDLSFRPAR